MIFSVILSIPRSKSRSASERNTEQSNPHRKQNTDVRTNFADKEHRFHKFPYG